ncbi:hypothetical protein GWK47_022423 [Chionoecetes opilio]|uniref:Secreted protein n=1 Tax=Chionoecetes opilio TaxID=41210 RepID=A0A8J4XQM7_CHIOP|nr:hypothetical protein GWK47_022423 [Chionoecetes opilio]
MLASLAVRKAVLAPVLTAVWGCAETLLAGGDMERCHRYLSTVDKVVGGCREDTESQQYLLQEWQGTCQILTMFTRLIRHSRPPHTRPSCASPPHCAPSWPWTGVCVCVRKREREGGGNRTILGVMDVYIHLYKLFSFHDQQIFASH